MKGAALLLAVLLPSPLLAQGLGDTAARERQKRAEKPQAPPAKVFTDQDLPQAAAPTSQGAPVDKDVSSRGAPVGSVDEGSAVSEPSPEPADPYEKERH